MKFLLDAHLPPSLKIVFKEKGLDVTHTSELPRSNETKDSEIGEYANQYDCVVVSKDTDFYYSHIAKNIPKKLLLVKSGNMGKEQLKNLFRQFLDDILIAFNTYNLVELHRNSIIF